MTQFANIECTPIENPAVKASIKDYADEEAFICHSVDHWLAIRKVHGVWYNLNSTNMVPPGPQIISNFYLSVFLDSIKNSGYTIFVIRTQPNKPLPLPNTRVFEEKYKSEGQMHISAKEIDDYHKANKNNKLNVSGQDERELDAALERSLKEMGGEEQKKEKPEEPKFQAFTGKGVSLSDAASEKKEGVDVNSELYKTLAAEYGDDPEMIQGIILSMQENEIS